RARRGRRRPGRSWRRPPRSGPWRRCTGCRRCPPCRRRGCSPCPARRR
ncbi:hypothetical protein MCGFDL_MCGFDL_17390, partial [Dysosmobacter welbionis]